MIARALLWSAAFGAAGASFAMNGYFWLTVMVAVGWQAQALAVTVSVLSGAFKTAIPSVVHSRGWTWRQAAGLWVLFVVCLSYDLASGLGYSTLSRGEAGKEIVAHNAGIVSAERDVKEAERARDRLSAPKVSLARLRVDLEAARSALARAKLAAGTCTPARAHLRPCQEVETAEATVADTDGAVLDAEAYGAAEAKVVSARANRAALGEPKTADAQAEALAKAFGKLGVDASGAGLAVGVLMLLILELGSTVAVAAATSAGSRPRRAPSVAPSTPAPAAPGPVQVATIAPTAPGSVSLRVAPPRLDLGKALVSIRDGSLTVDGCRASGDELHIVQDRLGAALNTSKPTISRALQALQAAGAVSVQAGRRGTVVKIINLPLS